MQPYFITLKKVWLILLIPVLLLPPILALTINPSPTYTASIGLWFDQPIYLDTTQSSTVTTDITSGIVNNYAASLTSLLNSHDFLVEVTDQLKEDGYSFSESTRDNLLIQINRGVVSNIAGNNFLIVSYMSDDSNLSLSIIKALTTRYTEFIQQTFLTSGQSMITFIQNQLNQAKIDLDKADLDAKTYLASHPDINNVPLTQNFVSDENLQRDLLILTRDQAQTRYNTLSTSLEQLKIGLLTVCI